MAGGFGAHPKHDAHALTTLSAIQILLMQDAGHLLDVERLTTCSSLVSFPLSFLPSSPSLTPSPPLPSLVVQPRFDRSAVFLSLQTPSGTFAGDQWGETDTRFLYIAVSALSLLGTLDRLDREKTIGWVRKCRNFDQGFGWGEESETHGGSGELDEFFVLFWLSERVWGLGSEGLERLNWSECLVLVLGWPGVDL